MISFDVNDDYRAVLQKIFEQKKARNRAYSLRAFARDLEISPSQLSETLKGKHGLSMEAALQICERLKFAPEEREYFCDLVESVCGRNAASKEWARIRLSKYKWQNQYKQIDLDVFATISDWYHFAILELLTAASAQHMKIPEIAEALAITKAQAEDAIARLLRLNMLCEEGGKYVPGSSSAHAGRDIPSDAIKQFHGQILQKAYDALSIHPIDTREVGTTFFRLNKVDMPATKKKLRESHADLVKEFESSSADRDELYCLSFQLFRLANIKKK